MKKKQMTIIISLILLITSICGCSNNTANISNQKQIFKSENANEHAILVDGKTKEYDNIEVIKTGDVDRGDDSDFYGTNAAVLATNGGKANIKNATINTDATYGNAVFSYGNGSEINISDSTIITTKHNSGGIMVTGGGTLNAKNLTIDTKGGSSAAIRSDRGGGNLYVEGGTYKSYGSGSPAIYSTANIKVENASLYSDISQAVVIEGKNQVTLTNVDAVSNHIKHNSDKTDRYQAVMIYQSMSGDASIGEGTFTMTGGSLTSQNGGLFFINNTNASINLSNVTLKNSTTDLMRIEAAGWGRSGSNGGNVTLNTTNQKMDGVITIDSISTLNYIMNDGTIFEGSIDSKGSVYVELNNNTKWKLTNDSKISSLTCKKDSIDLNGYKLIVGDKEYTAGEELKGEKIEAKVTSGEGGRFDGEMGGPIGEFGGGGEPPKKPDGKEPPKKPDGKEPPDMPGGNKPPKKPE